MPRRNSGSTSGNGNDNNYGDETELKLQKYAAVRFSPDRVNAFSGNWNDKFIANLEETAVLDGIVFQREDKPDTWKVFSPDKFHAFNPDDGRVYEEYDDGEYVNEMSAEDILNSARVQGFFETHGDDDYHYTPVGVVLEETGDVAFNDDVVGAGTEGPLTDEQAEQSRQDGEIVVGDTVMWLANTAWVRTFTKKITSLGEDFINDTGADYGENPMYDNREWYTTEDPSLDSDLQGRPLELWITEETREMDDGEEQTYTVPNLLDVRTSTEDNENYITIDNGFSEPDDDASSGSDQQAKADGGTSSASTSSSSSTETTETTQEPETTDDPEPEEEPEEAAEDDVQDDADDASDDASDDGGLTAEHREQLDELLDYYARTDGTVEVDEFRNFAESEVDDPDAVNWDACPAIVEDIAAAEYDG